MVSVGGGGAGAGRAGPVSVGADAEAVPAGPADPVAAGGVAGVFHRVSGGGAAAGAGPLRHGDGVCRHRLHLAVGDGARRCGDGAAPWDARGQGYVLWRGGAADAGAGADAVRRGVVAGCLQYPRHRADAVHGPRRIRPALSARRAGGGAGQRRKAPLAAASSGAGHAGEGCRHLGRPVGAGLSDRGAHRRPCGAAGGRRRGDGGDGTCPSVRGIRPALCVSGDAAGAADSGKPAADAVRRDHTGAAVLHGDGGPVAIGGAGLHHADIPADCAAVPAEQRRPYRSGGGAGRHPAGQPLFGGERQPAIELCRRAGHGAADTAALSDAERLVSQGSGGWWSG